ncbi:Phosphatidylinositol 4,5-bisphosphate-binding protein SLM1 [Fusarium culmorum]|uniref:Phosphatidylinositol 4,5-bisphosphate-binding protein SLM1 n=1 Tax=Fusarium culmorum TaxID=5516 RepID=A0A2T4GKV6_FUSCU|nr:Phosphatidylinositol 4,5-bisphosphate-binding protein SLM1 [Fusarium culmorum]
MDLPPSHSQSQPSSFPQQQSYTYSHGQDPYPESSPAVAGNNAHPYSSPQYDDEYHLSNSTHAPQPQSRQPGRFTEEWDAAQRGPSLLFDPSTNVANMQRSNSVHSFVSGDDQQLPGRQNTLKKKNSVRRNGSMKRSSSRRSMRAGSVKSLALQSSSDHDEGHSAFYCPVPTSGNPTETLSNRFQNWRKVLKDLIAYFREIQTHYEHRSKSLLKLANVSNNITTPPGFLQSAGIDDALQFLRDYNKNAILEANKAKEIEEDVILALTGLRSDLQQKIKEIKNLSGDFKNSVDKEMDHTRKAVKTLSDILGRNELDESSTTGKQDPYLLRLAVDRQVERQLDEENYLHQAYLNLENSGRELEAIVVGEIQKAYNAYAGILKREADNSYNLIGELREGPIAMPKDHEWMHFVTHDEKFVDPSIPLRTADQIHYPGQDHEAAQEIRAGLLERKSKYLKSYTAGWYVLSATHLHEFKTADKAQAPVMSLYLPEQKVGSHSNEGGSSNKFILKGRQTGGMHRGHTWVFRAESHDTMMAWYEDIKALTEKTAEERSQFVRSHSRSLSRSSRRSVSSDGLVDDEDEEPFTADTESFTNPGLRQHEATPGDLKQAPHSPSSLSSGFQDNKDPAVPPIVTGGLSGPAAGESQQTRDYGTVHQTPLDEMPSHAAIASQKAHYDGVNPYTSEPVNQSPAGPASFNQQQQYEQQYEQQNPIQLSEYVDQSHNQTYLPVMIPQGKEERNDNFANNEQPRYDDQPNNYAMEPREGQYGRDAMSGNVHQTSSYPQASYEPQPSYDQQPNHDHTNGNANGGSKINNYTLTTVGEGFPRLDGGATHGAQPSTRQAESVYTDRDSVLLQTDDEDETPMTRPSVNNRTESHNTISNLHIPGGYPKSSYAA